MALPNIFTPAVTSNLIERINKLTTSAQPLWGSMNAAQVPAHRNATYEPAYENIHPGPDPLMRFILK